MKPDPFFIAQGAHPVYLRPDMANRHGLIAGATGTGKTVTLRVLAENFSTMGVPVFMADVKGDLGGLAKPIVPNDFLKKRAEQMNVQIAPNGFPVTFWDVFGKSGHPIRATISEMGPLLLSQLLDLNDTQEGVLNIVFHVADEEGLLLIDLKDLQAMLSYIADNAAEYTTKYGNVSAVTVGAIQRALLTLQMQGGDKFFGEPALQLEHIMQTAEDGRGVINILAADKLITSPRSYAAMMLWLLSELFEQLPEIGDVEKPRLVFFFDEAHLLFTSMPGALQEKIEQVVRLVRSKGVGVYFVSQNPIDIPDKVLGQLGNRIQHALRAFTPRDQKAVKTAAETFRQNPKFNTETVIMELGVGEALVSVLDEKGTPTMVERALIAPPSSQLQPLADEERAAVIEGSPIYGVYDQTIDRESAAEILSGKTTPAAPTPPPVAPPLSNAGGYDAVASARARAAARQAGGAASPASVPTPVPAKPVPSAADEDKQALLRARVERMQAEAEERRARVAQREQKDSLLGGLVKAAATSATRSMATSATRSLMRGILGGLFGSSRKR